MFLFTILLIMAIILTVVVVLVTSVFGAGAIIIFGDVIVCILIIAGLMKLIFDRK